MNLAAKQYRVFTDPSLHTVGTSPTGGKLVAVFDSHPNAPFAELAQAAGVPLSMFITARTPTEQPTELHLRCFTPSKDKKESDSGALVALHHAQAPAGTVVQMSEAFVSRLQDGIYYLAQGNAQARYLSAEQQLSGAEIAEALGLTLADLASQYRPAWASVNRANLVVVVQDAATLDRIQANQERIAQLGRYTDTLGLIVLNPEGRAGSQADFRYFAPLKNLPEDNASSNTYATLLAYLALIGRIANGPQTVVATQGYGMAKPSRLYAQTQVHTQADTAQALDVWVGGWVQEIC